MDVVLGDSIHEINSITGLEPTIMLLCSALTLNYEQFVGKNTHKTVLCYVWIFQTQDLEQFIGN